MNQNKRKSGEHGSKFWRETSVISSTCDRSVICDQFSITIQFITPQSVNQELKMRKFIKDKIISTTAENQFFTQTGAEPSPNE